MEYHKINALYNRWRKGFDPLDTLPTGKKFGDFKDGEFACPEFEYLFNNQWVWSEKLDGTNIRIYANWSEDYGIHTFEVKGKAEDSNIPKDLLVWINNYIDENAKNITNALTGKNVLLYGEGVGTGIQKAGKHYGSQHFKLFDVNINGFWLKKEAVKDIADKINLETITTWVGTVQEAIDKVKTLPKSSFGDFVVEGYVGEPLVRLNTVQNKRIITKIKVCDFMSKKNKRMKNEN